MADMPIKILHCQEAVVKMENQSSLSRRERRVTIVSTLCITEKISGDLMPKSLDLKGGMAVKLDGNIYL
jgi:hypothetical protein